MFYFIPSWYDRERPWYAPTVPWFRVFERMSFDDTIHQVKMFQQSDEPTCLIILNYQPQLRYFLHNQGLYGSQYWSFFDDIQNISRRTTQTISFKELNWPEGTDFLYTPFAVVARLKGRVLAHVHFAENGNLLSVDFQKEGQIEKQYCFDDRGFLSSILYFDDQGQPLYQDYLNEYGVWQIREHLSEDRRGIEVNILSDHLFHQQFYECWEDLLSERLQLLKKQRMTVERDTLIIACHKQHNVSLQTIFTAYKKVYSFFGKRYDVTATDALRDLAAHADLMVVDTQKEQEEIRHSLALSGISDPKLLQLSPFDARLRLGHSQMLKEQILYFYIDTISLEELKQALRIIFDKMARMLDLELQIVTFHHQYPLTELQMWIRNYVRENYEEELFFKAVEGKGENQLQEEEEFDLFRIQLDCFSNEHQIIEALDSARLVLDLGEEPDHYTQIASISAGVPQIQCISSDYVVHQKNGWILKEVEQLGEAIDFYCIGLTNWNQSLVYTVQKMAEYTSGTLLHQWKRLLEE